jgi:hypothetical protein
VIILPAARGFLGSGAIVFSFAMPAPVAPGTPQVTASTPVQGLGAPTRASVTGGFNAAVSGDGATWGTSITLNPGATLYVRSDAPGAYGSTVTATVTIGAVSKPYTVRSCIQPSFAFANAPNQAPGATYTTPVVNTGSDGTGPISVTNGTPSQPTAAPYDNFSVSTPLAATWNATKTVTVSLLGYTTSFTVATSPAAPTYTWGSCGTCWCDFSVPSRLRTSASWMKVPLRV